MQEVIVQNFRAKKGTMMADAPEPPLSELLWTVAMARLILGPAMSIQARRRTREIVFSFQMAKFLPFAAHCGLRGASIVIASVCMLQVLVAAETTAR